MSESELFEIKYFIKGVACTHSELKEIKKHINSVLKEHKEKITITTEKLTITPKPTIPKPDAPLKSDSTKAKKTYKNYTEKVKECLIENKGKWFNTAEIQIEIPKISQVSVSDARKALKEIDGFEITKKAGSLTKYIAYKPTEELETEAQKPTEKKEAVGFIPQKERVLNYLRRMKKGTSIQKIAFGVKVNNDHAKKLVDELIDDGKVTHCEDSLGRNTLYMIAETEAKGNLCKVCMTNELKDGQKFCEECSGHYEKTFSIEEVKEVEE